MKSDESNAPASAQAIEDVAVQWLLKQDSGDWSELDQAEFDAWRSSAIAHRIAFIRLKAGWKGAARMKALGAGVPRGVVPSPASWGSDLFPGPRLPVLSSADSVSPSQNDSALRIRNSARLFRIAAAALLVLGIGFYAKEAVFSGKDLYSTPVGGLETVPLDDGSRITLNTDTRIHVALNAKERRIELDHGEAFFEVAKDPQRPFSVRVDDKRVVAVGTKFSVRRVGSDVRVVVTEGEVRLEQGSSASFLRAPNSEGMHATTGLVAGAVARTAQEQVILRHESVSAAERLLSWRSGYLLFDGASLADAVAEFNRYNTRQIVIADPAIAAFRVTGNFRAGNTDAFLSLLTEVFPVKLERRDAAVILTSH